MKATLRVLVLVLAAGSLGACSGLTSREQRVLSGGAIGAAGGAAITAIAGGPILLGTAIGAGAGAVAGAVIPNGLH
ncbi:MAG: hypothetical protein BGP12_15460 [Rhodospirillales bacterium 70-18]|nr:hypothetical protein [Rhodospirillales bacterium]OJY66689.1 MAG: hypothetical protein BGP12_15460 [Rhodospirillales bacterium 70-18]